MTKKHRTMYVTEFLKLRVRDFTVAEIVEIQATLEINNPKFASLLRVSVSSIEGYRSPVTSTRHRKPKGSTLLLLCGLHELAAAGLTWKRAEVQALTAAPAPVKKSAVKKAVAAIRAKKSI